jgi:hypothetical protein
MLNRVGWALRHARAGILIIATIYAVSLVAGIAMAHTGNRFALAYRDSLVARAHRADPAARADDAGAHGVAAAIDFSRNLGLAAIPDTIGGLTLVLPVGLASYRGWVGGIVSVNRDHQSRLRRGRADQDAGKGSAPGHFLGFHLTVHLARQWGQVRTLRNLYCTTHGEPARFFPDNLSFPPSRWAG